MWLISLSLCIVLISLWITWRKRKLSVFQRLNIAGPPPNLIFGNYWDLLHEGQHNCIHRWIKEYGKVFGYYYGLRPVLIVADLDLLRQIQQKEFHKFSSRPALYEVGTSTRKFNRHAIITVNGKRWKDLRSVMTPTFTISKLKMMSYIVEGAVDELVEAVENKSADGKPFDIYPLYQNLTMDVIARTSLGLHSEAQSGNDDTFIKLARIIMNTRMSFIAALTFSFTEIMPIFSFIRQVTLSMKNQGKYPREEMQEKVQTVIKARRNDPTSRRPDVLQMMMDAQKVDENVKNKNLTAGEDEDLIKNEITQEIPTKTGKGLTDEEIEQNAMIFLLAGYETTSTGLAFVTSCLAYHQDAQDKVRDEINRNIPQDKNISYEEVNKLQYLDRVMNEALRMYPPITYFVNRKAIEDTIVDSIYIPKDVAIQVPVYYLHHDPTIWDKPEIFNPDRFTPDETRNRHPMAFQAFGAGPRNCIGIRFAQMEIKIAVAKLIRKYKVLPKSGSTKETFKVCSTVLTLRPENGVEIQLEKI